MRTQLVRETLKPKKWESEVHEMHENKEERKDCNESKSYMKF